MTTPAETFKKMAAITMPMEQVVKTLLDRNPDEAKADQLRQNQSVLESFNTIGSQIVSAAENAIASSSKLSR